MSGVNELCMKLYGSVSLVVEEHEAAMVNAQSIIKRLTGEVSSLDAKRDELKYAHDRLYDKANSWEQECKQLEASAVCNRERISTVSAKRDYWHSQAVGLTRELDGYKTAAYQAGKERDEVRATCFTQEGDLAALQKANIELLQRNDWLSAKKDKLDVLVVAVEAECTRLRTVEKNLKRKVKRREATIEKVKQRLSPHLLADYGAYVDYKLYGPYTQEGIQWTPVSFEEFKASGDSRNLNYAGHEGHDD